LFISAEAIQPFLNRRLVWKDELIRGDHDRVSARRGNRANQAGRIAASGQPLDLLFPIVETGSD
jgi:hypothetical protein